MSPICLVSSAKFPDPHYERQATPSRVTQRLVKRQVQIMHEKADLLNKRNLYGCPVAGTSSAAGASLKSETIHPTYAMHDSK